MQATYSWHKFYLPGYKIVGLLLALFLSTLGMSQNNPTDHLPDYDEHFIHYGFLIGFHSSHYSIQYDDAYATPAFDSLHSVVPGNSGGFKLGFVVNFHLLDYLDFRVLPTVGFYENDLTYRFTDQTEIRNLNDATIVEIPLLFKYKSQRRGNYAMYLVGGIKPSFEAVGRGEQEENQSRLELLRNQVTLELGAGFDIYFPLFKFSPEIRYSFGLRNMLDTRSQSEFNAPLKSVNTHNIGLFVTFEGGPSTLSSGKKRRPFMKSGAPRRDKKKKIRF